LLATEFFRPTVRETEPDPAAHSSTQLGLLWHGIRDQLKTTALAIKERLVPHKEFTIWTSERYFDAWALSQTPEAQQAVYNELDPDLESVFDEHSFNKLSVCYAYGPNGIRNGYSQSMVEIAENFLQYLQTLGAPTERAELEVAVARYATAWMNTPTIAVGEKIVWISPRGSEAELYPGLQEENHVFVNILEKTTDGFVFHELRSYDPEQALPQLQMRIAQKSAGSAQKITSLHPQYRAQSVIANCIHVPASFPIASITNEIYSTKQKWKINIDTQIPKLNQLAETEHGLQVRHFCIQKFQELAQETLPQAEKIAAFDLLIVLVRRELNKWVENNASNYDANKQTAYTLHLDVVEKVWQIKRKKQMGARLATKENALVESFATMTQLNPALPLQRMTSLAHCIVGTPTSLLKIQTLPTMTSSLGSLAGFEVGILSDLSIADRQNYLSQLQRYVRVNVHGEVWYVPPEYLEGKGCYVDLDTGAIMGPCGLALADPRETNAKREHEYFALLKYLESDGAVDEKLATLSDAQREKVSGLYFSLLKCLFVSSASLEQILHADILRHKSDIKPQLLKLFETLQQALNPLPQLVLYLAEKAQYDFEEFEKLEAAAVGAPA
jgi:hypothetical protein